MSNEIFLSGKQFDQRYGIHRSTRSRWQKSDPNFPKGVQFYEGGYVRYRLSDVEAWEKTRIQNQRGA